MKNLSFCLKVTLNKKHRSSSLLWIIPAKRQEGDLSIQGWKLDHSHSEDPAEKKKYNFEVNTRRTIKVQVMGAQPVLRHSQYYNYVCKSWAFVKKKSSLAGGFQLVMGQLQRWMKKESFTFHFILQGCVSRSAWWYLSSKYGARIH